MSGLEGVLAGAVVLLALGLAVFFVMGVRVMRQMTDAKGRPADDHTRWQRPIGAADDAETREIHAAAIEAAAALEQARALTVIAQREASSARGDATAARADAAAAKAEANTARSEAQRIIGSAHNEA